MCFFVCKKATVLATIPQEQIDKFYKIIKDFLWKGGRAKLTLEKLQNCKEYGGLTLIDLKAKDTALKCQWVADIKNFPKIKLLSEEFLPPIKQDIWLANINPKEVKNIIPPNNFWHCVLLAWARVHWHTPENVTQIATQFLWYNSHLKRDKKVCFCKKAYESGILCFNNIWNLQDKDFFTYEQIQNIYGNDAISFLDYYGLIACIPQTWINAMKQVRCIMEDFEYPYENFSGKTTKQTYSKLITKKKILMDLTSKWNSKLESAITSDDLSNAFLDITKLVKDTKMRNFQFRFLHRMLYTANTLFRWKMVDSPRCLYCHDELETFDHLFFECNVIKSFLVKLQAWYESVTNTEFDMSQNLLYFCNSEDKPMLNTILIIAKQHIFSRRILEREPNVYILKDKIMEIVRIERFYALKSRKYKPFVKKWKDLF